MRELLDDPFYKLIENYKNCIIDYCLIKDDVPHQGKRSHKEAVLFALLKVIERSVSTQLKAELECCGQADEEPFPWSLDIGRAQAHRIDAEALLHVPEIPKTNSTDKRLCGYRLSEQQERGQIPYWYAFWNTPHISGYGPDDFRRVNSVLFPEGTEQLEVYEWSTDWSSYFDDGHEWWGAACWSVYDKSMDRYAVIMASASD